MCKNQEHNATMSKQLSGFLKSKFHETNLIAFFNRIKKNFYNISGWRQRNGCIQKSRLKDEFNRVISELCVLGWKTAWKATWAGGGWLWTGWERVASGALLAGSEVGWYLQSIIINDLQEVTSRTLIKCAHLAKWEIGGKNTRGRRVIHRYLFFSCGDLACEKGFDFTSPALSLLSWPYTSFLHGAPGEVTGRCL